MKTEALHLHAPRHTSRHIGPVAGAPGKRQKGLLARMVDVLYIWERRARERTMLAGTDERMLSDMGINAAERDRECKKPFWKK